MLYVYRGFITNRLEDIKNFCQMYLKEIKESVKDESLLFDIRLILNELIINSFEHGNKYKNDKKIEIVSIIDSDVIMIKVIDEGDGVLPFTINDIMKDSGRGLKLVYELSDEFLITENKVTAIIDNKNPFRKQFV
ncbi:MAG: ATP-binding protein [Tissierellia bacterium]|nr:ATP-binding protein [Tissierellia bacterium]